jgi:hypothetical protein
VIPTVISPEFPWVMVRGSGISVTVTCAERVAAKQNARGAKIRNAADRIDVLLYFQKTVRGWK